ncbi:MAG: preprotein translocase subunit SecE [Bacillota bacterium]|nr:preprotein translocase subunit SecE [Bacillota bacterium]
MGKKAGAVKARKSGKIRSEKGKAEPEKAKTEQNGEAVPQRKAGAFLRLVKPRGNQTQEKEAKKRPVKGKEHPPKEGRSPRAKEVRDKAKRKFFQETIRFFQSVWGELKKVHWPNRSEIIIYTAVVLSSVTFVALLIWIADSIFSRILELIL